MVQIEGTDGFYVHRQKDQIKYFFILSKNIQGIKPVIPGSKLCSLTLLLW